MFNGYCPLAWRRMKVVFIPKQGKNTYNEAKSYRPITLSSFVLKTMEKIVQWNIEESGALQMPGQHGFTPGKSTETAISIVLEKIE